MTGAFWRRRSLSVLTWNVWFGLEKPHRRWTELLDIVRRLRPDVAAFQEVTEPFLEMLRRAPWVRKSYALSDPRGEEIDSYGCVTVTRLPVLRTDVHRFESGMGRKLVLVEAEVRGEPWTFGNVHLESLAHSSQARGRQLAHAFGVLQDRPNVVLMGDFNFCSSWQEEDARLPPSYVDVWPVVSSEDGFTVDTRVNGMRGRATDAEKRVRFDRVLLRSDSARPATAELLGTAAIRDEAPDLFPSDHFGVYATFALAGRGRRATS